MSGFSGPPPRQRLSADITYYVRADGSDSNNGLANTSGGAWLTWQKAYDWVCANLDFAAHTVTIQIGDGTYTGALACNKGWVGGGILFFSGNSGTPANVVINPTGADCVKVSAPHSGIIQLKHFKLTTTTSGSGINVTSPGVKVVIDNLDFGSADAHMLSGAPGSGIYGVVSGTGYKISGGAVAHASVGFGGYLEIRAIVVTYTGIPSWSYEMFSAPNFGAMNVDFLVFSGPTATVTVTIATPGVFTDTGHGLTADTPVKFTTTGALPTGLVAGTWYYVIAAGLTANNYQVSATVGGAAINTFGSQSGVHTRMSGAKGRRFGSHNNSLIYSGGAGANYFPGNAAGVADTGGLYS